MRHPLFSFASVRNTQLVTADQRSQYFVHLPAERRQSSHYFRDLSSASYAELRVDIRRRASRFNGVMRLDEIRSAHADLISLYREIRSEGRRASLAGISAFVSRLSPQSLSPSAQIALWDNFVHYLFANPQEDEVGLIISILVADHFLGALRAVEATGTRISADEERHLRRASLARVVLSIPIQNRVPRGATARLSARQQPMLETAHDRFVGALSLRELNAARDELRAGTQRATLTAEAAAAAARLERETRLRESITSIGLDAAATRAIPALLRQADRSTPRPTLRLRDVTEGMSPPARALVQRGHDDSSDAASVLSIVDQQIASALEAADEDIETSTTTTFATLGIEVTQEERLAPGSVIIKASPAEAAGFHYFLTYFHGRRRPPLRRASGTLSIEGQAQAINATPEPTLHRDFQTFRLTTAAVEGAQATLSLQLLASAQDPSPQQLGPLTVWESAPHFALLALPLAADLPIEPALFGVTKLGVIDFQRVEQELSCYVTGPVSHIENVMASEFKERVSRSLSVIEQESEVSAESSTEQQSDTELAEKMEMQAEASTALSEETSRGFDVGAGVSANLGPVTLTADTNFNYNASSARQESTSQALQFARNVTQRIQEKITHKQSSRRRSLSRREFEDVNKHGFDNRTGTEHVVGVYRWVDKVLTNRLVNYGLRQVIEFQIPEPAKNFIHAQAGAEPTAGSVKPRPVHPRRRGMSGPGSIRRSNYARLGAYYGVAPEAPPPSHITVSRGFSENPVVSEAGGETSPFRTAAFNEIEVPDGYTAQHAAVSVAMHWNEEAGKLDDNDVWNNQPPMVFVSIAGTVFTEVPWNQVWHVDLPSVSGVIPVATSVHRTDAYVVTATVSCELNNRLFIKWQADTYKTIMSAYETQRDEYEEALRAQETETRRAQLNPRFQQQLMERELKRICIEMISRPFNVDTTANHYDAAEEGQLHRLRLEPALERHSAIVKFFEQAFDWQLMAYVFYPYFYSPESSWAAKINHAGARDPVFESFLTSGMSRAVVPVRKGFEDAVMFYLETGEVWFGSGFVLDVKNDLYLSIADELITGNEETVVEQTWQTVLPTSLTILQSRSAALVDDGLPCVDPLQRIGTGASTLSPVPTVPATP